MAFKSGAAQFEANVEVTSLSRNRLRINLRKRWHELRRAKAEMAKRRRLRRGASVGLRSRLRGCVVLLELAIESRLTDAEQSRGGKLVAAGFV